MESEPQQPQPPNGKPGAERAGDSTGVGAGLPVGKTAGRAGRKYPRPPGFLRRLVMLCLRPETWAEMARYPTHVTLLPLIAVIVLGAVGATAGQTVRQIEHLRHFAATYDQYYPAMELSSDGILRVKGELKTPVRVPAMWGAVLVDPTGQTKAEACEWDRTLAVVTDKYVVRMNALQDKLTYLPIAELGAPPYGLIKLPEQGQVKEINGAAIGEFLSNKMPVVIFGAILWAFMQGVGEAAWVLAMIFVLCPMIMVVAAGRGGEARRPALILPRRAAFRMAAGFMVPLVVVSAVLRGVGRPISEALGWEGAMLFWFGASGALAVWTGVMARGMYGGKRQ